MASQRHVGATFSHVCPYCGALWDRIEPLGFTCPTHGFLQRAEIDALRRASPQERSPRVGGPVSSSASPMSGEKEEAPRLRIVLSTDVPPPEGGDLDGLWGPFLPHPPGLVLLVGETSVGKTFLAYNLALHLAEGREFAGLRPSRALRVVYADLESPEQVHRALVHAVGRCLNLGFIRSLPQDLGRSKGQAEFLGACSKFAPEVVIIDPLSVAWPVADENDNAQADRQMWALKQMAVRLNYLCLVVWNMGEGNPKEKFRARGATARVDRADLALNYVQLSDTSRQLKIVKSRYGSLGMTLTLRHAGDLGFQAVDIGEGTTPRRMAQAQARIKEILRQERPRERHELVVTLGREGFPEDLVDKALHGLVVAGELRRPARGRYDLPDPGVSSSSADIGEEEMRKVTVDTGEILWEAEVR